MMERRSFIEKQSNDSNQAHGPAMLDRRQFLAAGMGVIATPSLAITSGVKINGNHSD
jgi:hypothetical protein